MSAIEACRTAELGGRVERCDDCAHVRIAYNSCRNRRLVVADSTVMEARRIQEEAAKAAEKPQDRNAPKRISRS